MTQKVLFLDDNENRITYAKYVLYRLEDLTVVRTAEEAIAAIRTTRPFFQIVSLDHDLGGEHFVDSERDDCGMEVVRYLCEEMPIVGIVLIHSYNALAANKMTAALRKALYTVIQSPFPVVQ